MRMEDFSLRRLWRLTNTLIQVRKGALTFRVKLKFSATRRYKILRLSTM
jgi:hypothetical protein